MYPSPKATGLPAGQLISAKAKTTYWGGTRVASMWRAWSIWNIA
jgi:hypothetical protein